jgi:hypothetical protein
MAQKKILFFFSLLPSPSPGVVVAGTVDTVVAAGIGPVVREIRQTSEWVITA